MDVDGAAKGFFAEAADDTRRSKVYRIKETSIPMIR
jgi:hypothetical protein